MTFCVEFECDTAFEGFDPEALFKETAAFALKALKCPYECEVSLTITDPDGIRELNRSFRDKDAPTDVLSFPMLTLKPPGDFSSVEEGDPESFDPDTNELMLGDIVINSERVISQAAEYGHSQKREFAFLILHSMLHLLGFDHETPDDEKEMFSLQEDLLSEMGIGRDPD